MANVTNVQILEDGDRNVVVLVVGVLDTSNLAATTVLDPALLAARIPPAVALAIERAEFAVAPQIAVQVLFDATADVPALALVGTGEIKPYRTGGIPNNAGAGVTGKIQVATTGWASGTQVFTLLLFCKKY